MAPSKYYLALLTGDGFFNGKMYNLRTECREIFIGRKQGKGFFIVCNGPTVSKCHCVLKYENSQWSVENLGSMKGVFINHELVSGKKTLNVGDELGIGSHQYTGRECFIFKLFKIDDMEVEGFPQTDEQVRRIWFHRNKDRKLAKNISCIVIITAEKRKNADSFARNHQKKKKNKIVVKKQFNRIIPPSDSTDESEDDQVSVLGNQQDEEKIIKEDKELSERNKSPSLVQQPNASSETKPLVPRTKAPTKVKNTSNTRQDGFIATGVSGLPASGAQKRELTISQLNLQKKPKMESKTVTPAAFSSAKKSSPTSASKASKSNEENADYKPQFKSIAKRVSHVICGKRENGSRPISAGSRSSKPIHDKDSAIPLGPKSDNRRKNQLTAPENKPVWPLGDCRR